MTQDDSLNIDCHAVKQMRDDGVDHVLLDVRTPDEHNIVHLKGAMLIPMQEITSRLGELEPHRDRRIVVHCHLGGRSERVALWLREQGFVKAQNMAGGIDAWAVEIDPSLVRY